MKQILLSLLTRVSAALFPPPLPMGRNGKMKALLYKAYEESPILWHQDSKGKPFEGGNPPIGWGNLTIEEKAHLSSFYGE